jgi:hypothetical protein
MAPKIFRFFSPIKRSNVSSASASTTSVIPPTKELTQDVYASGGLDSQIHPLFKKVQQTWCDSQVFCHLAILIMYSSGIIAIVGGPKFNELR